MHLDSQSQLRQTASAIKDAEKRLGSKSFQWVAWPQVWPSSGCGRAGNGIVMHAFWNAQTVVCSGESEEVLVYHDGEFAYSVSEPTSEFWTQCGKRKLPGQREWPAVSGLYDNAAKKSDS